MKKTFTFWKSLFLLCALIVGTSSAWATDVTVTWNINGVKTSQTASAGGKVNTELKTSSVSGGSGTWTAESSTTKSYANTESTENAAQLGASSSRQFTGTITLSGSSIPSNATITNITVNLKSNGSSTLSATVDGETFGTSKSITSSTSYGDFSIDGSGSGNNIVLTFSDTQASKYIRIKTIKVTYSEVISPSINASSPINYEADIISGEIPYTVSSPIVGKTLNATSNDAWISNISVGAEKVTFDMEENTGEARTGTITLSYEGATSKDITINQAAAVAKHTVTINACENGSLAVLRGEDNVASGSVVPEGATLKIVATPDPGYRFKNWQYNTGSSWSTRYTNNQDYTMPASDVQFRANFEFITTHEIKWSVNGTIVKTENVEEDTPINFAAPTSGIPSGYAFTGWVTEENKIDTPTDTDPSANYVTSGNCVENITYYAVIAKVTSSTPESWIETALSDMTASDIFVFSNGSKALNNNNGTSSAPDQNDITVVNGKITSAVADKLKWQVSGNATDGYTFYPNGDDETWLYCNTTAKSSSNNNIRVGTGDRKLWEFTASGYLKTKDSYTARYLCVGTENPDFRGYTGTANAFVPIFYKYTAASATYAGYCTTSPTDITITDLRNVPGSTYTGKNYATMYYSDKAFAVPEGVIAKTYKMEGGVLTESRTYENGSVIPAGEAVVVESDVAGNYSFVVSSTETTPDKDNALCGTDAATIVDETGYKYYKLALNNDKNKVGFFFAVTGGASINNGAHKAYLRVATGAGAKNFYLFDDTATGINNVVISDESDDSTPMYNLAGQRVNKSYKGVVIQNGKKMFNK